MYLSIDVSTHLSSHLSIHCSILLFPKGITNCLSIYWSVYVSIYRCVYPSIYPLFYLIIPKSVTHSTSAPRVLVPSSDMRGVIPKSRTVYQSIDLCKYPSIYPPIYLSIDRSTGLFMYLCSIPERSAHSTSARPESSRQFHIHSESSEYHGLSICRSIYLSIYVSVYLSICLSIHLSIYSSSMHLCGASTSRLLWIIVLLPIILRTLLIVATPYEYILHMCLSLYCTRIWDKRAL